MWESRPVCSGLLVGSVLTIAIFRRLLGVSITSRLCFSVKVSNASYWVRMGVNWDLFCLQLFWSHSLLDLCGFILQKTEGMVTSLERDKRCNHL